MAAYWVVGGEYEDTSFTHIAGGGAEERFGPYGTVEQAKSVWRAKSIASVDNCNVRFHIERDGGTEFWVGNNVGIGKDHVANRLMVTDISGAAAEMTVEGFGDRRLKLGSRHRLTRQALEQDL